MTQTTNPWAKMDCGHPVGMSYPTPDPEQPWRCARCDMLTAQVELARTEGALNVCEAHLENACASLGAAMDKLSKAEAAAAVWKKAAKIKRASAWRWFRLWKIEADDNEAQSPFIVPK